MVPKICAVISLVIFAIATWIGFVELDNPNRWENKLKARLNVIFIRLKWNWAVDNRFALTKIGLIIGFGLGITSIVLA